MKNNNAENEKMPAYLKQYEQIYKKNPRAANLAWFKKARYGLFIHYGLYSLLDEGEWVQYKRPIRVADYEKLADRFTAENFDAAEIVGFARASGMKYITFTTRHHDSFCLFNTKQTDFNSINAASKRDLVQELIDECEKKGIALFLYYSHGRDWKHPHAPGNENYINHLSNTTPRPIYEPPEPTYKTGDEADLNIYLEFVHNQCMELISQYPTAAGFWFDGIGVPMIRGDIQAFKCRQLYDAIHAASPHMILSYKQGLLGTEDFFDIECKTPPRDYLKPVADVEGFNPYDPALIVELCTKMNSEGWSYRSTGKHLSVGEVWETLKIAAGQDCNLLLNTGPLGDGSLDTADTQILLKVGEKIHKKGLPSVNHDIQPAINIHKNKNANYDW